MKNLKKLEIDRILSAQDSERKIDLKLISFPGKIHLILNDQELAETFEELHTVQELGFDTETRPSFKKGEVYQVALLQLSTDTDAYLVRLHGITNFDPIKKIFENKEILKVGVAIRDDLKGLQKLFQFRAENFMELQALAKEKGLKNFGLKSMAEEVLHAKLSKRFKTTNWQAKTLTEQQLRYAATDAWIGRLLYKTISSPDFMSLHKKD
jgi:ribonuclease D